jgi:hypothetical protein
MVHMVMSFVMLNVVILSFVMLNVLVQSVIMLSVVEPSKGLNYKSFNAFVIHALTTISWCVFTPVISFNRIEHFSTSNKTCNKLLHQR